MTYLDHLFWNLLTLPFKSYPPTRVTVSYNGHHYCTRQILRTKTSTTHRISKAPEIGQVAIGLGNMGCRYGVDGLAGGHEQVSQSEEEIIWRAVERKEKEKGKRSLRVPGAERNLSLSSCSQFR